MTLPTPRRRAAELPGLGGRPEGRAGATPEGSSARRRAALAILRFQSTPKAPPPPFENNATMLAAPQARTCAPRHLVALVLALALALPSIASGRVLMQLTTLSGELAAVVGHLLPRAPLPQAVTARAAFPPSCLAGRAILIAADRPGQAPTRWEPAAAAAQPPPHVVPLARPRPPAAVPTRAASAPNDCCPRPAGTCRSSWQTASACRCRPPTPGSSLPSSPDSVWRLQAPGAPPRPPQPPLLPRPAVLLRRGPRRRLQPPASPHWSPLAPRPG